MRVVIAGGTGFVGKRLCERLLQHGHQVSVLSRDASARSSLPASVDVQTWDPAGAPPQLREGTEAIVNLAGESIAGGRWTEQRKARIRESRMQATDALVEAIKASSPQPSVLVNASAVGYYGARGDEPLSEDAAPGRGFLTDVVLEWEHRARAAESLGVRVVLLRIGVVLGRDAGALPQMSMPFKLFVGGPVASGKQWMSWIHIDDVVGMIVWAIENPQVSGPVNAVAPQALTNAEFSKEIGRALGRPSWLPAPAFALELLFGEMAEALLVNGQRVVPSRAQELGYSFEYPTARAALEEALG
jgi:uncharacterized protein (TIGR01777 family)